jgi:uncharacterized membrane protein
MDEMNSAGSSRVTAERSNVLFIIIGWIAAVLSLFIYPFIFGILGVIMGVLASKGGSRAGVPLIAASIILMGIGLIFSGVILNYTRHLLGI